MTLAPTSGKHQATLRVRRELEPLGESTAVPESRDEASFDRREVSASPGALAGKALRILGTGSMFALFGIGAVALAYGVLPLVGLRRRNALEAELGAQRWIHRSFRRFVRLGEVLRLFRLDVEAEAGWVRPGALIVANHPTLLDVVFLISQLPQADCIVKREAWSNPFLRGIVTAAGYISNEGGDALVNACIARLEAGRTVVLFPEGTRSPKAGLGNFARGAAHVAWASRCPIVPVVLRCEPPALWKGQPWYALPNRELEISMSAGEVLWARDLVAPGESRAIAAREITRTLREYFERRLHRHSRSK